MRRESYEAARRWLVKASADLDACRILLAADEAPLAVVCFHAQQAAEKAVKALLTASAVPFPKTHNLATLARLLPEGIDAGLSLNEQVELTYFAVGPRYPDDLSDIDTRLATRLADRARSCYGTAERWLTAHAPS